MNENGARSTPLWVTELGWGSGRPDRFGLSKGPVGQARLLTAAFKLILDHRKAWNVQRLFWFDWRDPEQRGGGQVQLLRHRRPAQLRPHQEAGVLRVQTLRLRPVRQPTELGRGSSTLPGMGEMSRGRPIQGRPPASARSPNSQGERRSTRPLRVQLWSWNYEPEPTAMGPIAARWAETMSARGHQVEVVTAHPHYPGPLWGRHARPYRETRNGIPVLRLPLMIGHRTTAARITRGGDLRGLGGGGRGTGVHVRTWRWPSRRRSSACFRCWPAPGATVPVGPLARGHPPRRRSDHRADARGPRAPHGPAPRTVRLPVRATASW